LLATGWGWYVFVGTKPNVAFSVRFEQPAFSGQSILCDNRQLVFLHGDTLARYDIKSKKQVWVRRLVDPKQAEEAAEEYLKEEQAAQKRARLEMGDVGDAGLPARDRLVRSIVRRAAEELKLHVSGHNIWISTPEKLVRYEWDTGNPANEIPIENEDGNLTTRGDELLVFGGSFGGPETLTRINLATARTRIEQARGVTVNPVATSTNKGAPGGDGILDPVKVAADVQRMSYAQKAALPATLSVARGQQRILDQIKEDEEGVSASALNALSHAAPPNYAERTSIVPTQDGTVQFSRRLLEYRMVGRKAMKDPPKTSALNGNVSVLDTMDVANEILNDIQRQHGADVIEEDESRYLVTLRRPDVPEAREWRGEVIGPPALFTLNTVTVLAAGKTIIVFDKFNRKLWQSTLAYKIGTDVETSPATDPTAGQGPCAEHGDTLFICDEGVLSAFVLATGEARWRLPSVGLAGLFFDGAGMLYANSSSANPENIKYSRQIDVTQKIKPVVMKIEEKTGRMIWTAEPGGVISYLSGPFIYTLASFRPLENEEGKPKDEDSAPPFMRIRRINPRDGEVMWEHFQQRAPLDARFDRNTIELVFKKEVQVLKFLAF
jgi:hypothetical protein